MGDFVVRASRRLLADVDDLVDQVAAAIQGAGLYDDSGVTAEDLRSAHRSNLVALLEFLGGNPTEGLAAPHATGRLRGGQGAPLPAVLRAYRLGASAVWGRLLAMAGDDATAQVDLLEGASQAWQIFDQYTQAVTVSYQEAVADQALRDAARRGAALDAVFAGQATGARLWDCVTTLRMPQRGTFVAVVAVLPNHAVEDALPGIEAELTTLGVRSAWRLQLGGQAGVVSLTDTFTVERLCTKIAARCTTAVGVSRCYTGLGDSHTALRQAQLASTAAESGIQRLLRYEHALVPALLAGAPEEAGALTAAVLGPVLAMPIADRDVLIQTLECWFESDGEIAAVAEKLYCHRNTVRARLNRITDATGRDVATPAGAVQLYLAMEARRISKLDGTDRVLPQSN